MEQSHGVRENKDGGVLVFRGKKKSARIRYKKNKEEIGETRRMEKKE